LQQRDYVDIEDVVSASLLALDSEVMNFHYYNVGTGKPTTVLEYAQKLARQMGVDLEPENPGAYRVGGVRHTVSSIDKLNQLGWTPTRNLDEIFTHYLGWLATLPDTEDYFTPAYETMRQEGVSSAPEITPPLAANY